MNSRVLIVVILSVLASCSSFRKYKVIPVDSEPRGVQVFDEDKTLVGETPFFYKLDPSWDHDFFYKDTEEDFNEVDYKCRLDWGQSVIPAAVVSVIAPPTGAIIGGSFIGMDILRGGVYKCDHPLNFDATGAKVEDSPKQQIKRILVLPPNVPDESFSDEIVYNWKHEYFEKKNVEKFKDEIVDYAKTKELLHFNGVDHLKKTTPMQLRPKVLRKLGYENEVSHILFFDIEDKGTHFNIKPVLADAFNNEEVKESYLESFEIKKPDSLKKTVLSTIIQSISFLPNGASVVYRNRPELDFSDRRNGQNFEDFKAGSHPNALPRFVSILSLDTIDHPQFYNPWDVSMKFSPSFGASSWQAAYNEYKINLLSYYAIYNLNLNFHTVFGALNIGIGYGFGYFVGEDSLDKDVSEVNSMIKTNMGYVAFFDDRYYFKFNVDAYGVAGGVRTSRYDLESWTEVSVGIGYYFPEIKSVIRGWLPF